MIKAEKNDTLNRLRASGFNIVCTGLRTIVLWLVKDMHTDLKGVLQAMPRMQLQIENLEDKRLVDRLRMFEMLPRGRHEEHITYDSLTSK